METVLLKFCNKISSSLVSFLPPAILNELARKKDVDAWDRALNGRSTGGVRCLRFGVGGGSVLGWALEEAVPHGF